MGHYACDMRPEWFQQESKMKKTKGMKGLMMKYFVLAPHSRDDGHALASREAILAYSKCIHWYNPKLAEDLSDWVEEMNANDPRGQV